MHGSAPPVWEKALSLFKIDAWYYSSVGLTVEYSLTITRLVLYIIMEPGQGRSLRTCLRSEDSHAAFWEL